MSSQYNSGILQNTSKMIRYLVWYLWTTVLFSSQDWGYSFSCSGGRAGGTTYLPLSATTSCPHSCGFDSPALLQFACKLNLWLWSPDLGINCASFSIHVCLVWLEHPMFPLHRAISSKEVVYTQNKLHTESVGLTFLHSHTHRDQGEGHLEVANIAATCTFCRLYSKCW